MSKPNQVEELYIVRALAMIAVVMIHMTTGGIYTLPATSSLYPIYLSLNMFSSFAVPVFIFLSGFVMFLNYYHKPFDFKSVLSFYKKRLIFIIFPYFIFSIFYFGVSIYVNYIEPPQDMITAITAFLKALFTGGAFYHLYFMFIIIQFYLLFPILLYLLKITWIAKNAIWIGIVLQMGFYYLNTYELHWLFSPLLAISYIAFYMFGAFLGIYYDKTKDWLNLHGKPTFSLKRGISLLIWLLWIASGVFYVYLNYVSRIQNIWISESQYVWIIFSLAASIVLFQFSFWVYRRVSAKWVNVAIHIGVHSFGIYLIHPFILEIYNKIAVIQNIAMLHMKTIIGFVVVFGFSWLITSLLTRYVSWSWVLFGASPKVIPFKKSK